MRCTKQSNGTIERDYLSYVKPPEPEDYRESRSTSATSCRCGTDDEGTISPFSGASSLKPASMLLRTE